MTDENYTFTQARTRLEEIVAQVRSKDVSLEKSLDLLEEGVRLANICTEQSDHTEWRSVVSDEIAGESDESAAEVEGDVEGEGARAAEAVSEEEAASAEEAEFDATEGAAADDAAANPTSEELEEAADGESSEEDEA